MKHKGPFIAFLAVAAFAVGCQQEEATSRQFDKVKTETKEAAREMEDYTFAQKAEYTQKMEAQLAEINRDLDQLSAKIEKSSEAAKAEAKPKLQALREQTDKLNRQLEAAKSATESTWYEVKSVSRKAYAELRDGFQQARQWASEKIAP